MAHDPRFPPRHPPVDPIGNTEYPPMVPPPAGDYSSRLAAAGGWNRPPTMRDVYRQLEGQIDEAAASQRAAMDVHEQGYSREGQLRLEAEREKGRQIDARISSQQAKNEYAEDALAGRTSEIDKPAAGTRFTPRYWYGDDTVAKADREAGGRRTVRKIKEAEEAAKAGREERYEKGITSGLKGTEGEYERKVEIYSQMSNDEMNINFGGPRALTKPLYWTNPKTGKKEISEAHKDYDPRKLKPVYYTDNQGRPRVKMVKVAGPTPSSDPIGMPIYMDPERLKRPVGMPIYMDPERLKRPDKVVAPTFTDAMAKRDRDYDVFPGDRNKHIDAMSRRDRDYDVVPGDRNIYIGAREPRGTPPLGPPDPVVAPSGEDKSSGEAAAAGDSPQARALQVTPSEDRLRQVVDFGGRSILGQQVMQFDDDGNPIIDEDVLHPLTQVGGNVPAYLGGSGFPDPEEEFRDRVNYEMPAARVLQWRLPSPSRLARPAPGQRTPPSDQPVGFLKMAEERRKASQAYWKRAAEQRRLEAERAAEKRRLIEDWAKADDLDEAERVAPATEPLAEPLEEIQPFADSWDSDLTPEEAEEEAALAGDPAADVPASSTSTTTFTGPPDAPAVFGDQSSTFARPGPTEEQLDLRAATAQSRIDKADRADAIRYARDPRNQPGFWYKRTGDPKADAAMHIAMAQAMGGVWGEEVRGRAAVRGEQMRGGTAVEGEQIRGQAAARVAQLQADAAARVAQLQGEASVAGEQIQGQTAREQMLSQQAQLERALEHKSDAELIEMLKLPNLTFAMKTAIQNKMLANQGVPPAGAGGAGGERMGAGDAIRELQDRDPPLFAKLEAMVADFGTDAGIRDPLGVVAGGIGALFGGYFHPGNKDQLRITKDKLSALIRTRAINRGNIKAVAAYLASAYDEEVWAYLEHVDVTTRRFLENVLAGNIPAYLGG